MTQGSKLPGAYNEYNRVLDRIFFADLCENFMKNYFKRENVCNDELWNSGLETISIAIMGNARKTLNRLNSTSDVAAESRAILNEKNMKENGKRNFI